MEKCLYKIVIGGEGGVGKSCYILHSQKNDFFPNNSLTVGVNFHIITCEVDSQEFQFQIWDLGGQKRFQFLHSDYIKNAKIGIIMFDLTRIRTFQAIWKWEGIMRESNSTLPILLIGSKTDLKSQRKIYESDITPLIDDLNFFDYLEISSKIGENIDSGSVIETIVDKIQKDQIQPI